MYFYKNVECQCVYFLNYLIATNNLDLFMTKII